MINLHACWVDKDHEVDATKLRNHGIDRPFLDARSSNATAEYMDTLQKQGFTPGLYWAWNWYPDLDGTRLADKIHQDLRRINWQGNPEVCVDIESHDVAYIRAFIHTWRILRPRRTTYLTVEGMQGGILQAVDTDIANGRIILAPQLYDGNMNPLPHSPIIDVLLMGLPSDLVVGMYDAARLPYRWSGFSFTQGRLP